MAKTKIKKVRPGDDWVAEQIAKREQRARLVETFSKDVVELAEETGTLSRVEDVVPVQETEAPQRADSRLDGEAEIMGRLARLDSGGNAAYDLLGTWRPPMAVDAEMRKPFAADIAEAKGQVERERYEKLSPAEQQLFDLEQQQAQVLAKQQAEKDHADWLATPEVAATLKRLRDLDAATALDPEWDFPETVAIARAEYALSTVGVDRDAAMQLVQAAFNIDKGKRLTAMSEQERQIEALQAEVAAKRQTIAALEPATEQPAPDPTEPEWESPYAESLAKINALLGKSKTDTATPAESVTPADNAVKDS